jgi:nucleoside-diphosphate kinase
VIKSKESGQVLDAILSEGYEISAMQIFNLNRASAAEFLEVYDGIVIEFNAMVDDLISGPALVLEIRAEKAVASFRESAGPWDISFAKELFPLTLRARFGRNNVQNAVHCTDLEGDGVSEVGFFFDLLTTKC